MSYKIDTGVKFAWGMEAEDRILQNVANLLNTIWGETALDRTMGLNPDFYDKPITEQKSMLFTAMSDLIREREPRAALKDIQTLSVDTKSDVLLKVVIARA